MPVSAGEQKQSTEQFMKEMGVYESEVLHNKTDSLRKAQQNLNKDLLNEVPQMMGAGLEFMSPPSNQQHFRQYSNLQLPTGGATSHYNPMSAPPESQSL